MIARAPAAAARAAAAVAVALLAAGCVRSRHPELRVASPTDAPPAATAAAPEDGLGPVIAEPVDGAAATSPIRVAGHLGDTTGRVAVVQVLSLDADGQETRRGNALLAPSGEGGAYAADVPYTLDAAGRGIVEVVLVEPESGTVTERARVAVVLEPAP